MKFAGAAMWDTTCAYCGRQIYRGEYVIVEGLIDRKTYHLECYRKMREEKEAKAKWLKSFMM
jgi:hypothetical protein